MVMSYKDIIEKYSDTVYRISLANLRNREDAEDVYQEVFLALTKHIHALQNEEHIKHWLIRTTLHRVKNAQGLPWRLRKIPLDEATQMEQCENENLILEVREVINNLPKKLKSIVYLHYYERYSTKEISEILKIKEGTVKSRLHTARKKLRIALGDM